MEGISIGPQVPQVQHSPVTSTMPEQTPSPLESIVPSSVGPDVKNTNDNTISTICKSHNKINNTFNNTVNNTLNNTSNSTNYNTSTIISKSTIDNTLSVSVDTVDNTNNLSTINDSTNRNLHNHFSNIKFCNTNTSNMTTSNDNNASKSDLSHNTASTIFFPLPIHSNPFSSNSCFYQNNNPPISNNIPTSNYFFSLNPTPSFNNIYANIQTNKKDKTEYFERQLTDHQIKSEASLFDITPTIKQPQHFNPDFRTQFHDDFKQQLFFNHQIPIKSHPFSFAPHQQHSYPIHLPSQQPTTTFFRPWNDTTFA